jgi:hypothetical protein
MTAKKKASAAPPRIRQAAPPLVMIRTAPENHAGEDFLDGGVWVGEI